jgi:hypothetical protein|tara:strand:+ start:774 stop:956 length:183 start_codon:yes stop_codon:yes gene_type:complete
MNIFKPEEWTLIRQSLDTVTIQGKDAKAVASIQSRVENEIQKAITKRDKELEKLKENGNK